MTTMIDLKNSPVFDVHCFAYNDDAMDANAFAGQYAMVATTPPSMSDAERIATASRQGLSTGALKKRIKDIAGYLGTEPTLEAVVA
jgi:hypothetical protein